MNDGELGVPGLVVAAAGAAPNMNDGELGAPGLAAAEVGAAPNVNDGEAVLAMGSPAGEALNVNKGEAEPELPASEEEPKLPGALSRRKTNGCVVADDGDEPACSGSRPSPTALIVNSVAPGQTTTRVAVKPPS